jgi:flagellin-like hook-associated protein FlgL
MSLRSEVQDLDYTEAALRFAALQQQLQAGLLIAQRVNSLSLLDFLS